MNPTINLTYGLLVIVNACETASFKLREILQANCKAVSSASCECVGPNCSVYRAVEGHKCSYNWPRFIRDKLISGLASF